MLTRALFVFLILLSSFTTKSQIFFEGLLNTGLNMSIKSEYISSEGRRIVTDYHFPGINTGLGFGARLKFYKNWSLGLGIKYEFKYHESKILDIPQNRPNAQYPIHFITVPLDLNYTFKNNIGLHLGIELRKLLAPNVSNPVFHYQEQIITIGILGISYTIGRFRLELLYKHSFDYYIKQTTQYYPVSPATLQENITLNRFHDIQLGIAVRLFSIDT